MLKKRVITHLMALQSARIITRPATTFQLFQCGLNNQTRPDGSFSLRDKPHTPATQLGKKA
jgi:hypothetical protein